MQNYSFYGLDPRMSNIDVEFEQAVRAALYQLRELKHAPNDEEPLSRAWRALLYAKLLYNDIWRKYGHDYGTSPEKLYKAVKETDAILPRGKNLLPVLRSLRRQVKEIRMAYKTRNNNSKT